ncbi:UDP-N-acetylmuramoyl-L-alanyl-D-glutamate--2,6-diaminopimelate ligase, partial [Pseudovibrio sp. WM33]|uniref:UDP-N-acetylmuramoyl-L-alanyl-D-glutamate--2, 6-diaminopimelate ligase n=1 Tax=Pseudovibrio sp. WM33 TaxID=1735585 RepID=UPI001AD91169
MLLKDLTKQEIISAEGDGPDGVDTLNISGLTADSRAVEPGFVFAALKGAKVDGAQFIEQAVDAGAAAILIDADRLSDDIRKQAKQVPLIAAQDARRELALMAAAFSGKQPEKMVAVTGTAGKTSVAVFVRQIFEYAGLVSASLGTIGTVTSTGQSYGGLTTPDPVSLHEDLKRLAEDGITHAALEASSHGLDQHRLDGVQIVAAGFTNLGRDHMDYHPTVEDYLQAKLRLFCDLLPDDGVVVVDPETQFADRVLAIAEERGLKTFTTGVFGDDLKVLSVQPEGFSQVLELETAEGVFSVALPLAGDFQVSNALIAAGLAISAGVELQTVLEALTVLRGAPGRIEHVGTRENGALVFVDYAHKPEALENVLAALRPFAAGRLISVLGCGGDRDAGKRPLMGEISDRLADVSIVTDDNPRTEDPDKIREEIVAACPAALEIGDRALAIRQAVKMLQEGDVLCVAGKGHETGQIVGTEVLPFSDHEEIQKALAEASAENGASLAVENDLPEISLDLDEMDLLADEGDELAAADALDDDDLLAAVQAGVEELEAALPENPDDARDQEEEDWLALEEDVLGADDLADAELADVESHDPDFGKDGFPNVAEDTPDALEDELLGDLAA